VATHLEQEADQPDEIAGVLSLHHSAAGAYEAAWRYSRIAAQLAENAYAFVEAAGLYARAVDAGTKLPDLDKLEIGRVQELLGDAWRRAGEYRKALDAYVRAKELVAGHRLLEASLLLKFARMEETLGQYSEALLWVERVRGALEGLRGVEVDRIGATANVWQATLLQSQGNTAEAMKLAEKAAQQGEELDDPVVTAQAYLVLGWGYGVLGKEGGEAMMLKSLEADQRSGNRQRQAQTLGNLGSICYWDGRFDDAMSYFERAREEFIKIGSIAQATIPALGIGEILSDRGEYAEAELVLQQTLPILKASEYRYFVGYCVWMLGRVSLRANRIDEALTRFAEARTILEAVGAKDEVLDIDARLAECHLFRSQPDEALALADSILAQEDSSGAIARLSPYLHRIRAHAMLLQADPFGARDALESSVAIARERKDRFETALTLNAMVELDRLEGVEPPQDLVDESRAAIAALKIRALPAVPAIA
jgi:tetratricopeptide (TPR) repeat protein